MFNFKMVAVAIAKTQWSVTPSLRVAAFSHRNKNQTSVGAGADRMAYGGQPVADMPDALSHLSNGDAATEGTEFVELKLLADGQPVIMDHPIHLKYQDLYPGLDLWEAAKTGDLARLKELLDEGHAIDERQGGATPMYWAQYYLQPEAMEFLLERGADPNAKELVLLAARCRYPRGASHPATPFVFCPFRLGVSTRCTLLHSTKRTASVAPDCCSLPVRGLTCTGCVPFLFRLPP